MEAVCYQTCTWSRGLQFSIQIQYFRRIVLELHHLTKYYLLFIKGRGILQSEQAARVVLPVLALIFVLLNPPYHSL